MIQEHGAEHDPLLQTARNAHMIPPPCSLPTFIALVFICPSVMVVSGLLYFVPRNYGGFYVRKEGEIDVLHVVFACGVWLSFAWMSSLLALWLCHPVVKASAFSFGSVEAVSDLPWWLRRYKPLRGGVGVVVFVVISALIFVYFETRFSGWYLIGWWEIFEYPLTWIPWFTLAYMGRWYVHSRWIYTVLFAIWGIAWDTAIPGFVYVPNLGTWHQWVFAVGWARFVVDGFM